MKRWIVACVITFIAAVAFAQEPEVSAPETFDPDVAGADLSEIRNHINQIQQKIMLYKIINSWPSRYTGFLVAAMGAVDLYSVFTASKADLFVIRQAERMEMGAVGLGLGIAQKGGRLGAYARLPTKIAKFFSDISVAAFERGSQLLIINSKILSSGVTLSGLTWYAFSAGIVPSLIKYNMIELSMLKAYAASLATEEENLQRPETSEKPQKQLKQNKPE